MCFSRALNRQNLCLNGTEGISANYTPDHYHYQLGGWFRNEIKWCIICVRTRNKLSICIGSFDTIIRADHWLLFPIIITNNFLPVSQRFGWRFRVSCRHGSRHGFRRRGIWDADFGSFASIVDAKDKSHHWETVPPGQKHDSKLAKNTSGWFDTDWENLVRA